MKKVIIKKESLGIHIIFRKVVEKDSTLISIRELLTFKVFLFFKFQITK